MDARFDLLSQQLEESQKSLDDRLSARMDLLVSEVQSRCEQLVQKSIESADQKQGEKIAELAANVKGLKASVDTGFNNTDKDLSFLKDQGSIHQRRLMKLEEDVKVLKQEKVILEEKWSRSKMMCKRRVISLSQAPTVRLILV